MHLKCAKYGQPKKSEEKWGLYRKLSKRGRNIKTERKGQPQNFLQNWEVGIYQNQTK